MGRMMLEAEYDIVRAFDTVITFLEHSKEGRKKASREEQKTCLFVLGIISGKHPYVKFRSEVYGIVGLALLGTRYAYNKRALFLREWKDFCRRKCPERAEDFLVVCRKIRQDVGTNGITSQSVTRKDLFFSLPDEWRTFVL